MKRLLVVTPHFPPINAADMHRMRQSLSYYREFGWEPTVLTVHPDCVDGYLDESLLQTVPPEVPVLRAGALSISWTRLLGIRAIGLRALLTMARAGSRFLRGQGADLVLISTTAFPLMTLGAYWKRRHGVPYVLDIQDPWYTGAIARAGKYPLLSKAWLMRRLHSLLEPLALSHADGIMAVAPAYVPALRSRYPQLRESCCETIPFGLSALDYQYAKQVPPLTVPRLHRDRDQMVTGIFAGVSNPEMHPVVELLFRAMRHGLSAGIPEFSRLRLYFAGTNYATGDRIQKRVEPVAEYCGVADRVTEQPERLPYLATLSTLQSADFLLILGTTDFRYMPSKLYPYAMTHRPIFALCHERSPLVAAYRQLYGVSPVSFNSEEIRNAEALAPRVAQQFAAFLGRLPQGFPLDEDQLSKFSARALTQVQCNLFDKVLQAATGRDHTDHMA